MYEVKEDIADGKPKDGYFVQTHIIKELLLSLDDAGIKESYSTFVEANHEKELPVGCEMMGGIMHVFYGLLNALAYVCIQESGTSPNSSEYQIMVDKLAKLTGHTNGWYALEKEEMEKAWKRGLIPVNPTTWFGPLETDKPLVFINMNLFLKVIELAYGFLHGECCEPVKVKETGDDDLDLPLKMLQYFNNTYRSRCSLFGYMANHPEGLPPGKTVADPSNGKLKLEL